MKTKKQILSFILLFSMILSGFGINNISRAEDEVTPVDTPAIETVVEKAEMTTEEVKEVFNEEPEVIENNTKTEEESEILKEENIENLIEENTENALKDKSEEVEDAETKEQKKFVETETAETAETAETEGTEKLKVGEKKSFEHTDTIVKDDEKGIWRKIKDGDFFVEIQEAIKDEAGNIIGWLEGLFGETTPLGPSYKDPVTGDRVQDKEIEIKDNHFPIEAETDGSGKWVANITPDKERTSYFKVTESKKYQEREILNEIKDDEGNIIGYEEGDLIYLDAYGNETKEATRMEHEDPDDPDSLMVEVPNSPKMSNHKLPGVTYDETIYYLKYKINDITGEPELTEVKVVIAGVDNDPFKDLEKYTKEDIEEHGNGTMPRGDNPIDKFVEYLESQGKIGLADTEDLFNGLNSYDKTTILKDKDGNPILDEDGKEQEVPLLSFNNIFTPPVGEGKIEEKKNLLVDH